MSTMSTVSAASTVTTSISPCLWFDGDLEEAAEFYVSIFPNSSVGAMSRYGEAGPGEPGTVMAGEFTLDGLLFRGINGGAQFTFNQAVSMSVSCDGQDEVDRYWEGLLAGGGQEVQCGWLTDRFGLAWQVVPVQLYQALSDPDPARAQAATTAMLGMKRIVIADLQAAADAAG